MPVIILLMETHFIGKISDGFRDSAAMALNRGTCASKTAIRAAMSAAKAESISRQVRIARV